MKGNNKQKVFQLLIKEAYYLQHSQRNPVNINYLDVTLDGRIKSEGTDEVGNFLIEGIFRNNEIKFDKKYVGQHIVNYYGKFKKNTLETIYFFESENSIDEGDKFFQKFNNKLSKNESNSGFIFKNNVLEYNVNEKFHIFLFDNQKNANNGQNELYGIMFSKDGINEISLKTNQDTGFDCAAPVGSESSKGLLEIYRNDGTLKLYEIEYDEASGDVYKFDEYKQD